jgi:hypothetical protein
MSPDLEKRLVSEFPDLFADYGKSPQESCMAWGCEHSDGWFNIILSLCRSISSHIKNSKEGVEFKFTQVKEKFGTLRVYTYGGDDYIEGVIAMAESMSALTCEVTGEPGQMCAKGHWYRTLSKEQALADGYVVCGDKKEEEVEGG